MKHFMKLLLNFTYCWVIIISGTLVEDVFGARDPADQNWPRLYNNESNQLTVYQPQIYSWNGYTNLQLRSTVGVRSATNAAKFGVLEVKAETVTDLEARTVAVYETQCSLRFVNVGDSEAMILVAAVENLCPTGDLTSSAIERALSNLNLKQQTLQRQVEQSLIPPKVFVSSRPAILVTFTGQPEFCPLATNRTDLEFALNANWDIFYDTSERRFYLLDGEFWLSTRNLLYGQWTVASTIPRSIKSLPNDENWSDVRKHLRRKSLRTVPTVFIATEPAELIVINGPPRYTPVPGTKLLRVNNTESALFVDLADKSLYFSAGGNWFQAESLSGPWTRSSKDLPVDLARTPGSGSVAQPVTGSDGISALDSAKERGRARRNAQDEAIRREQERQLQARRTARAIQYRIAAQQRTYPLYLTGKSWVLVTLGP
jgi:hypothetical protein